MSLRDILEAGSNTYHMTGTLRSLRPEPFENDEAKVVDGCVLRVRRKSGCFPGATELAFGIDLHPDKLRVLLGKTVDIAYRSAEDPRDRATYERTYVTGPDGVEQKGSWLLVG